MVRPAQPTELSTLEFHVLLALASGPLYGYAIKEAVAEESSGTLTPRAGTLYRVLGRMMGSGFVKVTPPPTDAPAHPGLERKYYLLTAGGRKALAIEAQRLKQSAGMAQRRLGLKGHS